MLLDYLLHYSQPIPHVNAKISFVLQRQLRKGEVAHVGMLIESAVHIANVANQASHVGIK